MHGMIAPYPDIRLEEIRTHAFTIRGVDYKVLMINALTSRGEVAMMAEIARLREDGIQQLGFALDDDKGTRGLIANIVKVCTEST